MCLGAYPAGVLAAYQPAPATLGPLGWSCADVANAVNVANYSSGNPANPLGIPFAKADWTHAEIASTPGSLAANVRGIAPADANGTSGSIASPLPSIGFVAGFADATEIDEFPSTSLPANSQVSTDKDVDITVLPSGTALHDPVTFPNAAASPETGHGIPYMQIFPISKGAPDFGHGLIAGGVPAQVGVQNYNPTYDPAQTPAVFLPNGIKCQPASGGPLYSAVYFDVTPHIGHELQAGVTYAAYLLARNTGVSGPLGDHLWFFQAAPPAALAPVAVQTPQLGSLVGHIFRCSNGNPTSTEVPNGTITTSIGGTSASKPNPATFAGLPPGPYPAIATAPVGFEFVDCPSTSTTYTITNNGLTATYAQLLNVAANHSTQARFYVVATPLPNFVVSAAVSPAGSVPNNTALTYTVTVTNAAQTAANPGVLTDALSSAGGAACSIVTAASVTAGALTSSNACPGNWSWDLSAVTLGPAGSANDKAGFTVEIDGLSLGALTNSASLANSNCPQANMAPPCSTTTSVNMVLVKANKPDNSAPIAAGTTITYTITLTNPTDNAATNVVMKDVLTGTAGVTVDKTSFRSSPAIVGNNVTCTVSDCTTFTWTWGLIPKASPAVLVYNAAITAPSSGAGVANSVTLTNTVSSPGLPPASVSNQTPVSAVRSARSTPRTGAASEVNAALAEALFLGGLALILIGLFAEKREITVRLF
jgi:uncharacterized repeat protein (TIGR01451 family)